MLRSPPRAGLAISRSAFARAPARGV